MMFKSKKISILIIVCLPLVSLFMAIGLSQTTTKEPVAISNDAEAYSNLEMSFSRKPIRHLIIYKKSRRNKPKNPEDGLEIGILVGGKDFNKENLIKLADFLHKKFPKPQYLPIEVHSNFQTAKLPQEWTIPSEVLDREKPNMFRNALIMRDLDDNRWFSYELRDGSLKRDTVVLKGCTPRKELCVDKKMQKE